MPQFRRKPLVIEAVQLTRAATSITAVKAFCPGIFIAKAPDGNPTGHIASVDGVLRADPGDWVVKGVAGEFYPVKPEIFAATYEAVP